MLKKLGLLLAFSSGVLYAYQPLRTQLPVETKAYAYTPTLWDWLLLGDEQPSKPFHKTVSALREQLQTHGFVNLPAPLKGMGREVLAQLNGGVELAVLGERLDSVLALQVSDEKAAQTVVSALEKQPMQLEGKRFVASHKRPTQACYEYADERLLVADKCQWLERLEAKSAFAVPAALPKVQSEAYFFNIRDGLLHSKDPQTRQLAQALQWDKVEWAHVVYEPAGAGKRLAVHLKHQSPVLKPWLMGDGVARDFAVQENVQSALVWRMPQLETVRTIAPAVLSAVNAYLQQQSLPFGAQELVQALAGEWAWVQEGASYVLLWQGDTQPFDAWIDKLVQKGWVQKSALDDEMTQLRFLNKTTKPEQLMLATMFPTDVYYRDHGKVRAFASLPQILHDRARAKARLQTFAPDAKSALWYGVQIDNLQQKQYYMHLKWLRFIAERAGQPLDLTQLPSARDLDFALRSAVLLQGRQDDEGLVLEMRLPHSGFDALVWFEESTYSSTAVAGILAAIAVPAYQDYVKRARAARSKRP